MPSVHFFAEETAFKLPHPRKTTRWIKESLLREQKAFSAINFIFCSDDYLRNINQQYLAHDTYTDIVTFDTREEPGVIQGDIFISIDRVKENAATFEVTFDEELHRVIIHGVLHLAGYSDKKQMDKKVMREKEDAYLSLRT